MDYEDYRDRCTELAESFESGDFGTAEAGWRELLDAEELSVIDRSLMLHNLALTLGAVQRNEEAEAAFDQAISWERPLMRGAVRVGKVGWLRGLGRTGEAAALMDELAAEPWATWGERREYLEQAAQLRGSSAVHTAPERAAPQRPRWWRGRR